MSQHTGEDGVVFRQPTGSRGLHNDLRIKAGTPGQRPQKATVGSDVTALPKEPCLGPLWATLTSVLIVEHA